MSLSKVTTSTVIPRNVTTSLHENDYRRIILQLQNELTAKNARLRGVYSLTQMLHDAEGQCKLLAEKSKNTERLLSRAEARIAQLNKFYGIGPQTALNRGVVMPGVSRKDFDLVSQENIKLKSALDHIEGSSVRGHEIVLKNKELFDLVSYLKAELSNKDNHIKELEDMLQNTENLAVVPEMQRKIMHLEKSLESKQLFCETLIEDNNQLRSKEGEQELDQEPSQDSVDGRNKEIEKHEQDNAKLKAQIEELEQEITPLKDCELELNGVKNLVSELQDKINFLEAEKHSQSETLKHERRENEQLNKDVMELKKKCDGFFKQVVSLNSKQKESEEEVVRVKRAYDLQTAEGEEQKAMIQLMTESLKSYSDDFRRENEEKGKFQKMSDKAQQETERYKRENMSHIATIKHLEDEYERMSKMLTDERKNKALKSNYRAPIMGASQSMIPQGYHRGITVSDGVGVDEGMHSKRPSMPVTKTESSTTPSLIECPYCSRSYPYHLIEGHVSDCMEENLRFDE